MKALIAFCALLLPVAGAQAGHFRMLIQADGGAAAASSAGGAAASASVSDAAPVVVVDQSVAVATAQINALNLQIAQLQAQLQAARTASVLAVAPLQVPVAAVANPNCGASASSAVATGTCTSGVCSSGGCGGGGSRAVSVTRRRLFGGVIARSRSVRRR